MVEGDRRELDQEGRIRLIVAQRTSDVEHDLFVGRDDFDPQRAGGIEEPGRSAPARFR